jgi:hypothetical protein
MTTGGAKTLDDTQTPLTRLQTLMMLRQALMML